jgi:predicted phosphate transport protein (TIGR00153 family)
MQPAGDPDFRRKVDDAVLVIFALVAESIGWATSALLSQDVERALEVIDDDEAIDERCGALVAMVKERLASNPPDAGELENLIAILQIAPELERSADLAEHIAQRARRNLGGELSPKARGLIQEMGDKAIRMWHLAGQAYRQRSRDSSFELSAADDELDDLATQLVSDSLLGGVEPTVAAEMALLARFYERLGDHAVNLSRRVDTMPAPRRLSRLTSHTTPKSPAEKSGRVRRVLGGLSRLRLVPTDEGFFDLFEAAAVNAREAAEELHKWIATFDDVDEHFDRIKGFERRGDEITVDLLRRLDASFVTPYDREDIHALTEELDDVVDDLFAAATMLQLVDDGDRLPELAEMSDVLVEMTDELVGLMGGLSSGQGARYRLERIEHLERQGDAIHRRSMGRLFSGEYDALDVIRWKDVVQSVESALNAIEDVSDVVESILVKES